MPEVGQHLRDVDALAGGMAEQGLAAVDLTQFQLTPARTVRSSAGFRVRVRIFAIRGPPLSARTSAALPAVSALLRQFAERCSALSSRIPRLDLADAARRDTLNSSTPRPTSTGTASGSAASSPQTPTHLPWACAARTVMSISCSTAGCKPVGLRRERRVTTIDGQRVLRQVVGADAEEIDFAGQHRSQQGSRRHFDHDPQLQVTDRNFQAQPLGHVPRLTPLFQSCRPSGT
jgi:hypothetical protein